MVAICCRAIINDAKLLILDEPFDGTLLKRVSMLSNTIIETQKDKGMAIMLPNHKLDEIYEIADRLTILKRKMWLQDQSEDLTGNGSLNV